MNLGYVKHGDYYVPNIKLQAKNTNYKIGKYGRLRERYLKENKPGFYDYLLMTGELPKHINLIDKEAKSQVNYLIKQISKKEKLNENLKNTEPLTWVGIMNNIKNQAEEIVINQLIFNKKTKEKRYDL